MTDRRFSLFQQTLNKLNRLTRSGIPLNVPSSGGTSSASSNSSDEDSDSDRPANTGVEPYPDEEQEQLVEISNAVFLEPESIRIGETTPVEATVNYLTERTPVAMQVRLKAVFEENESFGPFIDVQVENGKISTELEIIQNMDFYHKENKTPEDKVTYTFNVKCTADGTEAESESILLPEQFLNIDLIEILDNSFHHNSAVPCLIEDGGLTASISTLFKHLEEWPDKEVLVYGHTDTSGEHDYNFGLSERRANAIKAIISNDSDLWNNAITDKYTVTDYQTILKNLSKIWGWPCDPGNIDGDDGPKTQEGIKGFQTNYNTAYEASITIDGVIGPQTWGAICHTLHEISVTGSGFSPEDLNVNFVSSFSGIYPCGENFPIDQAGVNGLQSSSNRRVEIQCSDRPNPPQNAEPQPEMTNAEVVVYDLSICEINVIPIDIPIPGVIEIEAKTVEQFPIPRVSITITMEDESTFTTTTDQYGTAKFINLPTGMEAVYSYDDEEDLLHKSFCANFKGAIESTNQGLLARLLQSAVDFNLIKTLYEELNSVDLGEAIKDTFSSSSAWDAIEFMLVKAKLLEVNDIELVDGN